MGLSSKTRQQLKAKAHHLKPVVLLGQHGLTEAVQREIDRALHDHELIKIKFATEDKALRQQTFQDVCETLSAESVQQIGTILVLYRKRIDS